MARQLQGAGSCPPCRAPLLTKRVGIFLWDVALLEVLGVTLTIFDGQPGTSLKVITIDPTYS